MENYNKALHTLEYYKILEMLCDCAPTLGAKELAASLRPTGDPVRIGRLLTQTSDAKKLASLKGTPSFGAIKDILGAVDRADKDAVLTPRELLDVADVLRTSRILIDYINNDKRFDTVLDEIFARLASNRYLEDRITRAIVSEDVIADEASPALGDIRRKIRATNNKIRESLQKYITGTAYSKFLQDNIVTTRNGRYVIPVKAEHKNEIKGLVHDASASGATMFVEPLAVVEANNELRLLEGKEKAEIERILAEFSADVSSSSEALRLNYYNITELAFIFAKARLSEKMDAVEPKINSEHRVELYRARHPMISKKSVVPIDIKLGGEWDSLVITGSNTGGKTVTLKTLGLFSLMAQSGLHIPADYRSTLCIFDEIFADIGDEQSIEQSLSTFSSHMVNIVNITEHAGAKSLVLIDELGAGTDPVEGAALAVAVIDHLREKGALCAATTHYAELKAYALDTPGVCNASCEFDVESLRPTYRLILGTPGKSNAFAISLKLGLSESIVSRADQLINSENKQFENVIGKLEQSRLEMEKLRDEAEQMKREYEEFRAKNEAELKARLEAADKELNRAREQAKRILDSAKYSSDYVFEELEKVKRQRESEKLADSLDKARRDIRRRLRQSDDEVNPVEEVKLEGYTPKRPFKKGDAVVIVNINKSGTLLDDPDKDGNVMVQAGILKTRTNTKNLMLAEDAGISVTTKEKKAHAPAAYQQTLQRSFKAELDLRGQNGEDAWFMVDRYLDEAHVVGVHSVTLIHGKGTGALRTFLHKMLKGDTRVKSFRVGAWGEGDMGVTVVELK